MGEIRRGRRYQRLTSIPEMRTNFPFLGIFLTHFTFEPLDIQKVSVVPHQPLLTASPGCRAPGSFPPLLPELCQGINLAYLSAQYGHRNEAVDIHTWAGWAWRTQIQVGLENCKWELWWNSPALLQLTFVPPKSARIMAQ